MGIEQFVIEGGNRISGEVSIRGAKNAALPILIAAAAGSAPVQLENVPTSLNDVQVTIEALQHLGCEVRVQDGHVVINAGPGNITELPPSIAERTRYSLLFLGLLAGKHGSAHISFPGGCNLGERKFDLHLEGLRQLGAEVVLGESTIDVKADNLKGADIQFYLPTTTGTETVMLAACFAQGRTRIFNANTRPEVADMADCLNAMGANISVKNRVVEIEGGKPLTGCTHRIMTGWDEGMIYILAAGMTGGEVCLRDFSLEHIRADIGYLREAGLDIFSWGGNAYVSARGKKLGPFDLLTGPYPGVNSDMQPLFAAFASMCTGESTITDQRFTERFAYVRELRKFGMNIDAYGNSAVVQGPCKLHGANATALDLRCGAAIILAALAAEGTTVMDNIYQVNRGYEDLVPRFASLGAAIKSVSKK